MLGKKDIFQGGLYYEGNSIHNIILSIAEEVVEK